ncbi:MAG: L-threonylcarbamoyladenylate synthase [Eubacteriales bacterium]|nr:L-threonylcarbamoyladenylate synthase [Eubacteriales bacterium]
MKTFSKDEINKVIDFLNEEKVLALKTDTVYALVCNAFSKKAIENIYKIKGRDKNKPLILFIKNENELKKYVSSIPEISKEYIKKYWPGALTIIFKSNDKTLGVRIPKEEKLNELLNKLQYPLFSTSCNISGMSPCMNANDVKKNLYGKIEALWDLGDCIHTKASTIIDVSNNEVKVLRIGDIKI